MTVTHQIVFVPLPTNRAFNDGYGLSLEYRLLESVDFALDYSELLLSFDFCRITLRGNNLEALFELVRAHAVDRVEQADPGQAPVGSSTFRVTAMGREPMPGGQC